MNKSYLTDCIANFFKEELKFQFFSTISKKREAVFYKFYETDFRKETPYAPMGSRVFDLTEVLGVEKLPDIEEIAEELKKTTWQ